MENNNELLDEIRKTERKLEIVVLCMVLIGTYMVGIMISLTCKFSEEEWDITMKVVAAFNIIYVANYFWKLVKA